MLRRFSSVGFVCALLSGAALAGCGGSASQSPGAGSSGQSRSNGSGSQGQGPGGAGPLLQTPLFSTSYPAGWHRTLIHRKHAALYLLGSPGARVSELGIPSRGGIGVTVSYVPARALEHQLPDAPTAAPIELLKKLVGVPVPAAQATLVSAPHAATLGGAAAAGATVRYTYHGVGNLQENLVTRQSATVVLLELDTQPDRQAAGEAALQTMLSSWRWISATTGAV